MHRLVRSVVAQGLAAGRASSIMQGVRRRLADGSGATGGPSATGATKKLLPTVGIDLGTTNSCVAVMEGTEVKILENEEGKRTTPSIVGFLADGSRVVGAPAKRQSVTNSRNTIYAAKRLIGRRFEDAETKKVKSSVPYAVTAAPNGDAWVSLENGQTFSPSQVGSFVLTKMVDTAERYLGGRPTKAVVTVPAYFNDSQRQATKDAGRICGFENVRIVNEPTAACLAYGMTVKDAQTLVVYDLGGGTFDVSILEVANNVFEVKATNGNAFLGGEDFDETLIHHMLAHFKAQKGIDLSKDSVALQRLREAAEEVKRGLDNQPQTDVNLPFITMDKSGPLHFTQTISKATLETLTKPLVEKTRAPCEQCLRDAKISLKQISKVLLVGGMTRMPLVQETCKAIFGQEPSKGINPDEAVAAGAAIQGGILDGAMRGIALIDVTPLSLGTNVEGGLFARIIDRNTPIPTKKTKMFTTATDSQTYIVAQILQGDREMAADNKLLGNLKLDGIPPMRRGVPQIDVTFDINAEGLMKVTTTDLATGAKAETVVQTSGGLSESEIQQMIRDAERYAGQDKERREAIEVKNGAEALVHSTRDALEANKKLLTPEDARAIETVLLDLEAKVKGTTPTADLKAAVAKVTENTSSVFERAYKSRAAPQGGQGPQGSRQ